MATHLTIVQGTPFHLIVTVTRKTEDVVLPYPLTNCVIRLQARMHIASCRAVLDISSLGNEINITDDEGGVFEINLTSEQTAKLVWHKPHMRERAVFQCEVEPADGETFRVLDGTITLDPEVVR